LSTYIRSFGQLEVLMLLHRNAQRAWTPDQVNRELKTSLQSATQYLEDLRVTQLAEARLLENGEREYRISPADPQLLAVVQRVDAMLKDWVAAIVDAIYAPRQSSLRDFADAFRLGKRGDRDDG
jgi:hypothetical protein